MTGASQMSGTSTKTDPNGNRTGRKILMVEDDADNRNVYKLILQHRGFEVIEAVTGSEGLDLARSDLPDLILMDISLPGVNGWEVAKLLKAEERTRSIPILILTAHGLAADRALAAELGCEGFLVKPIAPSRIVEEVSLRLKSPVQFSSH